MSGYPSTPKALRGKIEAMIAVPDDALEWTRFARDEMRMPVWLLPAIQVAIRERSWESSLDPVVAIRGRVHKIAIGMRLSTGNQAAEDPDADEETGNPNRANTP